MSVVNVKFLTRWFAFALCCRSSVRSILHVYIKKKTLHYEEKPMLWEAIRILNS